MIPRRRFLHRTAAALLGAGTLTGLYTWRIEPEWLETVRRDLPIDGLPSALEGKTLVQLSDLHVGRRVDPDYLLDTFAHVASLAPDIVAMTGDWITWRGPREIEDLARLLEHFPRGRLATVGILGNHDYGVRWRLPDVADAVTARVRAAGITMLRDESVEVAGLTIGGLEDLWGPFFRGTETVRRLTAGPAALALAHNPDSADRPIWDGYRGWILSGHTHGGQCRPPFLPPPILPVDNPRYTSGEIALADGRRLYISRGVGYTLRVRFNARPEVTVFTLRAPVRSATAGVPAAPLEAPSRRLV